jgi:hypothetical protein
VPGWCLADARCGWARTITHRMSPGHQAAAWGSVQKVVEESARKEEELRRSLQQARDDGLRGASHARVQQEVRGCSRRCAFTRRLSVPEQRLFELGQHKAVNGHGWEGISI